MNELTAVEVTIVNCHRMGSENPSGKMKVFFLKIALFSA